jgi:hypothetical protein
MQAAAEIRLATAELKSCIADCEFIADAGSQPDAEKAAQAEPIYQTQMVGNAWADVSRDEYERTVKRFPQWARVIFIAPQQPEQSAEQDERREAREKAAEFMIAARNATMFQDVRELISTLTDPKANCPGRHIEARRVLPLLDAFLGDGYTGRVIALKRALTAENGPDFPDGPDSEGFSGPRPWNGFAQPAEQDGREIIRELQKALFYWMPRIAGEDSPAGQKAAEHSYLLVGLDDNSTECWGDQILHYVGTLNREQEKLGLVLSDAGCTEDDDYLQFIENLAARAASTSANLAQGAEAQSASSWHPDFVVVLYENSNPDRRYTMDQMREYADSFHRSRVEAEQKALTDRIDHIDDAGYVHWKAKK